MDVLKKTDLAKVRARNMKIVNDPGSMPLDISRASQIIIRIKALEIQSAPQAKKSLLRVKPLEIEDQVDKLSHLRVVG